MPPSVLRTLIDSLSNQEAFPWQPRWASLPPLVPMVSAAKEEAIAGLATIQGLSLLPSEYKNTFEQGHPPSPHQDTETPFPQSDPLTSRLVPACPSRTDCLGKAIGL